MVCDIIYFIKFTGKKSLVQLRILCNPFIKLLSQVKSQNDAVSYVFYSPKLTKIIGKRLQISQQLQVMKKI